MSIERFFTTQFTLQRMTWTGDSSAELAAGTSFYGHIQQTDNVLAESLGLRFTEAFTVWCPLTTSVQRDDRITDNLSRTYIVKFVQEYRVGNNTHLELVVEKYMDDYE